MCRVGRGATGLRQFPKNIFFWATFLISLCQPCLRNLKLYLPQSLLDLECQNPELRGSSGGVEGGSLRLLMDFCIFSGWSFSIALIQSDTIFTDIRVNAAVHSNNQVGKHCILFIFLSKAVVVLSNCEVRDCGGAGVKAEEGSTLNLLNCQVKKHSALVYQSLQNVYQNNLYVKQN